MQWRKDQNMKFTDLCIFIDKHVPEIVTPGENPELENKIYNYLWLLVKALAIKKNMFSNFSDYDPYCFYAANRLFFALRKNQVNQGKTIKGKLIRPIKSCLNYTKALLYPMKIEYQNQSFREVISEDAKSKKFDSFNMREQLKLNTSKAQGVHDLFRFYFGDSLKNCGKLLDNILEKTPFDKNGTEYRHIKISLLLNCVSVLKQRKKLDTLPNTIILWKLPKTMSGYIEILLRELFVALKKELLSCYQAVELDDDTLEKLISQTKPEDNNQYEE